MHNKLRNWQKEALHCYKIALSNQEKSILWEATPGAGKTTAALLMLSHQIRIGRGEPVLVVVPTAHLKLQWAQAAHRLKIHLNTETNGKKQDLSKDFHGAVTTYQQIAHSPSLFSEFTKNSPIILDEIHHAGDGLTWGEALEQALRNSRFILCLSGTAFRSDNNPIPFVSYSAKGESEPHYTYGYRDAIKDGVCRPVAFFSYGGSISWSEENGETVSASFSDPLDRLTSSKRLRAALDPRSGWIDPLLKDAHEKLLQIRKQQPDAGALLVCSDREHARSLAKTLNRITQTSPIIVLSDDARASKRIKEYSTGNTPWLIACNMVSEGVDIPRLRIGVFATTIRTRMYFRQFLGRIVRRTPKPEGVQLAYCYLPSDNRLSLLAEEIETEQRHIIAPIAEEMEFEGNDSRIKDKEKPENKFFEASSSINSGVQSIIVGGTPLPLFDGIQTLSQNPNIDEILESQVTSKIETELTKSEQKEHLSRHVKELVSRFHRLTGEPYPAIHSRLNKAQKVKSQIVCTTLQLNERIQLLEKLINSQSQTFTAPRV